MADYRDMPDPSSMEGTGSNGLFPDRPALIGWQKAVPAVSIVAWFSLGMATMFHVMGPSDRWLDQARASAPMPSLWFQPHGWTETAFMVPLILGAIVTVLNVQLVNKLTVLALLFAAMVASSTLATRAYILVMNDQVLIHPALPWDHDVRFALKSAIVTARGCRLWHSKSGVHHQIIFRVLGGPGGGRTIDLGEAAGRDIAAWLTVMRGYDDGYLPLAAAAGANAPHDGECIQYWLDKLDPQQQTELTRFLS